jgi:hypothetical protein
MKDLIFGNFRFLFSISIFLLGNNLSAQEISSDVSRIRSDQNKVIFYLHGALVTDLGNNAISPSMPEWGRYEYLNILDSIQKRGVWVISERRYPFIPDSVYANKITQQVDSLLACGTPEKNIVIIGASAGWNIALMVSLKLKKQIGYVLMGGCWPDSHYSYINWTIQGNFLSIIEESDPHKSCLTIFKNRHSSVRYKEIVLYTGLSHGFIYKGLAAWIDPIMEWMKSL